MSARTEVYVRIEPASGLIDTGISYVRLVLPYGPDSMPSDVRATWGRVRDSLERALRVARHDGETPLPNDLDPSRCIGITHEVPTRLILNPRVDLLALIEDDLKRMLIAALRSRDRDRVN